MQTFNTKVKCTFSEEVDSFLGLKFKNSRDKNNKVSIALSQEAYVENLLHQLHLHKDDINTPKSPYCSGLPIDSIPHKEYSSQTKEKLIKKCNIW